MPTYSYYHQRVKGEEVVHLPWMPHTHRVFGGRGALYFFRVTVVDDNR